jgi:hypothetical protein
VFGRCFILCVNFTVQLAFLVIECDVVLMFQDLYSNVGNMVLNFVFHFSQNGEVL